MALKKRIDELDPYGSVDDSKKKKDLFEVSKNSGPYGSPVYAVGDSRKITQEELENMLNYIPYSNSNCEIVKNNGTALENGTRLIQALAKCYAKTPNGQPLSNTNRAVVYLLAGNYDLGGNTLTIGLYVDIISLSNPESVVITSSNATSTFGIALSHNYVLSGFTINNSGAGLSIDITASIDNGAWSKLILNAGTAQQKNYNGSYGFITCNALCFSGNISGRIYNSTGNIAYSAIGSIIISGIIEDCQTTIGIGSSLLGHITISGKIKNCTAVEKSFGYSEAPSSYGVVISGTIENCTSGNNSFGCSESVEVTISGKIKNCTAVEKSFGYSEGPVTISGFIDNCIGTDYCFGASLTTYCNLNSASIITNCTARDYSFAYTDSISGYTTIVGFINNCTGRDYCFASRTGGSALASIQGVINNTKAFGNSFGYSPTLTNGAILGTVENCNATSFGATSFGAGKLINCTGNYLRGLQAGEVNKCNFTNQSGSIVDVASISDSCVLRYSTFIQLEPTKDSIKINSGASVKISHCESNKDFNLISGDPYSNLIHIPNNVIWTETGIKIPSPDGSIWRLTIDNSGIPTTELIP